MSVQGRKRGFQRGSIRKKNGKWIGRWRTYTKSGNARNHSRTLGFVSEMPPEKAKEVLRQIIKIEDHQTNSLDSLIHSAHVIDPIAFRLEIQKRTAHITGSIAEMIVAADLLSRGFEVCKPIDQFASFDLLYMDDLRAVRVEVKVAEFDSRGIPNCDLTRNLEKFDVLAIVDKTGAVHYRPAETALKKAAGI